MFSAIGAITLWTMMFTSPCNGVDLMPWYNAFNVEFRKALMIPLALRSVEDEIALELTILPNGRIQHTVKSSGHYEEALNAARTAVQLMVVPPLPEGFQDQCLKTVLRVRYKSVKVLLMFDSSCGCAGAAK